MSDVCMNTVLVILIIFFFGVLVFVCREKFTNVISNFNNLHDFSVPLFLPEGKDLIIIADSKDLMACLDPESSKVTKDLKNQPVSVDSKTEVINLDMQTPAVPTMKEMFGKTKVIKD